MTLGQKLKEQRNRLGYSQEKIAEIVGTSRQAVTKWETDQSIPCMNNLITLAKTYSIPLTELTNSENTDIDYEPDNTSARFNGKIGIWWIVLIIFVNAFLAYIAYVSYENTWAFLMIIGIYLLLNSFMAIITFRNYVILHNGKLTIHFGLSKTSIDCNGIMSISKTNSPLSGSALSFDRLLITSNKGMSIISVKDNTALINQLLELNDKIEVK
jgi:transcriptional regulator with XRE-family HTH domain